MFYALNISFGGVMFFLLYVLIIIHILSISVQYKKHYCQKIAHYNLVCEGKVIFKTMLSRTDGRGDGGSLVLSHPNIG